jgi:hypothetical protein
MGLPTCTSTGLRLVELARQDVSVPTLPVHEQRRSPERGRYEERG